MENRPDIRSHASDDKKSPADEREHSPAEPNFLFSDRNANRLYPPLHGRAENRVDHRPKHKGPANLKEQRQQGPCASALKQHPAAQHHHRHVSAFSKHVFVL
jgi:hypothetical protein